MTRTRLARLAVLAMSLSLATAGCGAMPDFIDGGGKFEFHCPSPVAAGLAIAVGARANSPKPTLSGEVRQHIVDSINGCGKITVVRVDGRPATVGQALVFSSAAKTKQNFQIEQQQFIEKVGRALAGATAQVAEANVLAALGIAAGAAGPGGTVVLIDSGLQTTDPIDLRRNNLTDKKPKAIADALKQQGQLPSLKDRTVILAGLGYTAAPQAALDEIGQTFVHDLWYEIVVDGGGAEPTFVTEPNTNPAAISNPTVGEVTFKAGSVNLSCDALTVLPDNGEVGFVPDQAEFKNPAAARQVLDRFVPFLKENTKATLEIQGFVAHYGKGDLSQRRADRVKQELMKLGVSNQITAKGMGWGPFPNPTAPGDPRYDQLNRRVTIRVSCG